MSEINYLLSNKPLGILEMIARDGMKFLGYKLGMKEMIIPVLIKQHISMVKTYWSD